MGKIFMVIALVLACGVEVSSVAVLVAYYPLTPQRDPFSPKVFDVKFTYAFTGLRNATGEDHDHFGWGIETYPSDYYPLTAILNSTY